MNIFSQYHRVTIWFFGEYSCSAIFSSLKKWLLFFSFYIKNSSLEKTIIFCNVFFHNFSNYLPIRSFVNRSYTPTKIRTDSYGLNRTSAFDIVIFHRVFYYSWVYCLYLVFVFSSIYQPHVVQNAIGARLWLDAGTSPRRRFN